MTELLLNLIMYMTLHRIKVNRIKVNWIKIDYWLANSWLINSNENQLNDRDSIEVRPG